MAVLEAMASQLPVITTNVGGASDLIEPGLNGCIVAPDDVPALQEAVLSVLADPVCMVHMGCRSRERVLRDHALPVITDRLSILYEQLATRHGAFHRSQYKKHYRG